MTGSSGAYDIQKWTLNLMCATSETTHSGSGGWRNRVSTVKDWKAQIEVGWDDASTPEDNGFGQGDTVTGVVFALGDSGVSYTGSSAIVTDIGFTVDNQNGHVIAVIQLEGNGAVTGPA